MDHEYIREHQIVSLYLASKLPQAECADFEDHLAGCRQCMDEVELTDDFRRTLRNVAAADAIRTPAAEKAWPWFAATAALLAAAVFIGALYLGQKRELEGTRAASAAWEQRYRLEQAARQTAESQ